MPLLLPFIISTLLTIALIPVLKSRAGGLKVVDLPDPRKVHSRPIPKVGGIAMAAGVLAPLLAWAPGDRLTQGVLAGLGIIFVFGLLDDIKNLNYRYKFAGQMLAAGMAVFWGGLKITSMGALLPEATMVHPVLSIPLTLIAIVGVTNAINLADGLDGLAGGIMLMTFISTAYLAFLAQNAFVMLASVVVIGAIFGFLRFNTHPAMVFMGDTGSQMLGYMGVCLCLTLSQPHCAVSPLFPLLLLGLPVMDTLTVMTERIIAGGSPFKPDKRHLHHKLMALGLHHSEAVFIIYLLQAAMIVLAVSLRYHSDWVLLAIYLLFWAALAPLVGAAVKNHWQIPRRDFINSAIKGPFRRWRERRILIRMADRTLTVLAPLTLAMYAVEVSAVPWYLTLLICMLVGLLVAAPRGASDWSGTALRITVYLLAPVIFYLATTSPVGWWTPAMELVRHGAFAVLAVTAFVTLKFTRRRQGFKPTPTDFLVIFIALAGTLFLGSEATQLRYGDIAAKLLILLYAYEVAACERRGCFRSVNFLTAAALSVVVANGAFSFFKHLP